MVGVWIVLVWTGLGVFGHRWVGLVWVDRVFGCGFYVVVWSGGK